MKQPTGPPLSFLFVVNELVFDLERLDPHHPLSDKWFNTIPPPHHAVYTAEIPSPVMRYSDGHVPEAPAN
ncbi:hypothetical protein ESCO_005926 [Escovopsis weberi]|uniref:Uncharacterized protein n=1 Tax=Escovopsis weberi TaxID=150374 RepID=A0A0M8N042_ESCWE|nr:hypothetical protein ESCO_005926 [Escovopsis weberi]